jgi:hypothetical protein
MRLAWSRLVVHLAIGVGALVATLTFDPLQGLEVLVLWLFGTPWLAGLLALVLWQRSGTKVTWIIPATMLLLGLFLLAAAQAVSGIG